MSEELMRPKSFEKYCASQEEQIKKAIDGAKIVIVLCGILLFISFGVVSRIFSDAYTDAKGRRSAILFFLCILVFCSYLAIRATTSAFKKRKKWLEVDLPAAKKGVEMWNAGKAPDLFEACLKDGYTDIDHPACAEKAKLAAKQLDIQYKDLNQTFENSKEAYYQKNQQEQKAHIAEIREKERAKKRELEIFATYSGRNKRMNMLASEYAIEKTEYDSASRLLKAGSTAGRQKEMDWAVHGGIASGIAGAAAGIATAMDIQRKNAEIRAYNASLDASYMAAAPYILDVMSKHSTAMSRLDKEYEAAKTKLVAEDSEQEAFSALKFGEPTIKVTESGACEIKVSVSRIGNPVIFDAVPAVVDGTVKVTLSQSGKALGTALLVLPKFGLGSSPVTLEGLCDSKTATKSPKISASFSPHNLWLMER